MGIGAGRIVLGADLGGNNLRMAAVTERGEFLGRFRCPTVDRSVEAVLDAIDGGARSLLDGLAGAPRADALGIGVPGLVSPVDGSVTESPNFPSWRDVPLGALLRRRLGLPVRVENDVNAVALGEFARGAARGARDVLVVTLGTGVGGSLILDGRLRRGPDGTAGEVGHVTVRRRGLRCGCGNRGCLEAYASATAIAARAAALGGDASGGAQGVAALARLGDRRARRAFAEAAEALGIVLAGMANVLNLERVVIGGGVARSWDLLAPGVAREVEGRAFSLPARRLHIVPTELFDDAGVLGVARLALEVPPAPTSAP